MISTLLLVALLASSDSATSTFDVGGVRVILRRSAASDVIAANLYLLGGTRQIADSNAGIEPFLLVASEHGTRRYSRKALYEATAKTGATFVIEPTTDWTMFGVRTLAPYFDSTWAVFADRVLHPVLDSAAIEQVRGVLVSGARRGRDSPDELLQFLADSIAFEGHPYARHSAGTPASLSRISRQELRRYHDREFVTSRILVVVVGNVTRARVEGLVLRTLANLPRGFYRWSLPPPIAPLRAAVVSVIPRTLPTNYILGYYSGPPASSEDFNALRVACAVLAGRLFAEVRTRRNLTYAIDSPFLERAAGAGGFYVTTTSPDTVLSLIAAEVRRVQTTTLAPDQLSRLVAQFLTTYFLDNETNAAQATFLARHDLYQGGLGTSENFVDALRHVTPDDVRRVARKYISGTRFVYIGDPEKILPRATLGL